MTAWPKILGSAICGGLVVFGLCLATDAVMDDHELFDKDVCFKVDTTDKTQVCGHDQDVRDYLHDLGAAEFREAQSFLVSQGWSEGKPAGPFGSPLAMCLRRGDAQGEMHQWPYRDEYLDGCRDAKKSADEMKTSGLGPVGPSGQPS